MANERRRNLTLGNIQKIEICDGMPLYFQRKNLCSALYLLSNTFYTPLVINCEEEISHWVSITKHNA